MEEKESVSHLKEEKLRFEEKGYGWLVGVMIVCGYFYIVPLMLKRGWSGLVELCGGKGQEEDIYFKYKMCLICININHVLSLVVGNVSMYICYHWGWCQKYKVDKSRQWPWEKDPKGWNKQLKQTLWKVIGNAVLLHWLLATFDLFVMHDIRMRMDTTSFPNLKEMLSQMLLFMLVDDTLFYWSHRLLHLPSIYPYIHKQHHQYYETVSIASEYAHPIEALLSNILPAVAGYKLLTSSVHMATVAIWISLRVLESVDGHSGYEFPFSPFRLLPFHGSSSLHNFHHSHNVGNYGSLFNIWDTICQTNQQYYQHINQKRSKKHKIQ